MENPKPQRQRRQREKKVIKKEVKKQAKKQVRRQVQEHDTKSGKALMRTIELTERQLKNLRRRERKHEGPKVENAMVTTVTIGTIVGTTSRDLTRQTKTLLNPLMLKPADSGRASTPLSTRAAQYGLYKIRNLVVRVQPLVGRTVVAGSLCLVDIQQNGGSATPDTLDSIKARSYTEVPIGSMKTWRVPPKDLTGPRDGWWYVDTNDDPTQSLGPALNTWFFGNTKNLFGEGQDYLGPVFLLEIKVSYQFSNYTPKPALSTLLKTQIYSKGDSTAGFVNDTDGSLLLKLQTNQARLMAETREGERNGAIGSTLWSLASQQLEKLADQMGPWGWLFKNGWCILRRIFKTQYKVGGETRAAAVNNMLYKVYASAEDAAKDIPVYHNVNSEKNLPSGYFQVEQLNSNNLLNQDRASGPMAKTFNHDYLPTAAAPAYIDTLPFFYIYDPQEGYSKYDPPYAPHPDRDYFWNGIATVMGHTTIYWCQSSGKDEVYINAHWLDRSEGAPESITPGAHIIICHYGTDVQFVGGGKIEGYGAFHVHSTLMQTLEATIDAMDAEAWKTGKFTIPTQHEYLRNSHLFRVSEWKYQEKSDHKYEEALASVIGNPSDRNIVLGMRAVYIGGIRQTDAPEKNDVEHDAWIFITRRGVYGVTVVPRSPTEWKYPLPQYFTTWVDKANWPDHPWYLIRPAIPSIADLDGEPTENEVIRKRPKGQKKK
nr:MAG: capsid protein [Astroviridae sp.]